MNNTKIMISFALIAVVIAVSGCVGQKAVTVTQTDGLVITNFDSDAAVDGVGEGEIITFMLDVENQGGTDATFVKAELSGVEGSWRETDGSLVVDTLPKWGEITLRAPDLENNIPGDYKTTFWRLKTPDVPQLTYTLPPVIAKVTYNYHTTGSIQIHALGETYYRTEFSAKGKPVPNPMTVQNTNAPVQILLTDKTNPIIVEDTADADEIQVFPVRFVLKNVGSGFPITEGVPGKFFGTIQLAGPFKFYDCLGQQDTPRIDITEESEEFAKLKTKSGEAIISCELYVPRSVWGERQEETIDMKFDLFYRYYIDSSVSIKVFGSSR